ncbi:MAG: RNA pseudouridine synthase, partial [Firmicutes bacterium]|nr:RNA pseudouridine synthase [Bacillota bacterium]
MDALLADLLPDCSRSFLQKLIEKGAVSVNGATLKEKKYKVKAQDRLEVSLPEPELLAVEAENIPLDIVYEDDDVVVVNKPRGMVVHPAPGNYTGTMVNALLYHCKNLSSINGVIRPGIVHRIDKDTSGLLMVAKNDVAHRALAEQLAVHSITRMYQAVVFH